MDSSSKSNTTSTQQSIDLQTLKQLFEKSADVLFQEYTFGESKVMFITCDAMIDQQMYYSMVIPQIEEFFTNAKNQTIDEQMIQKLVLPDLKKITDKKEAISLVFNGNVLLYFEDLHVLFATNIAKKPNRNPEQTNMEVLVKGPRDNFIEDLSTNIALIRKRMPTNSLCIEKMTVGKRSKTNVAILYLDDVANKDILTELKRELNEVSIDIIVSADSLMEEVNKKNRFLPVTNYTGRPDFAIQSLSRGRFIILVDGTAYAVITPVNLSFLLKTAEDYENPVIFSTFERLLRVLGIVLGVTLPSFWLALTTFHQDQLPIQLLATVVVSNRGLPLPTVVEMLILIIMFELFREAGMRLPTVIGGTISVVGGLIIGDAAIRAGITSPAMVVVIAISTIATFTIVNQALLNMISILRIVFILSTAFFGLFGFFICLYALILYVSNVRIFGVPYVNISADLSWKTIRQSLFRLPKAEYEQRPNMLDPQDESRTSNKGSK